MSWHFRKFDCGRSCHTYIVNVKIIPQKFRKFEDPKLSLSKNLGNCRPLWQKYSLISTQIHPSAPTPNSSEKNSLKKNIGLCLGILYLYRPNWNLLIFIAYTLMIYHQTGFTDHHSFTYKAKYWNNPTQRWDLLTSIWNYNWLQRLVMPGRRDDLSNQIPLLGTSSVALCLPWLHNDYPAIHV